MPPWLDHQFKCSFSSWQPMLPCICKGNSETKWANAFFSRACLWHRMGAVFAYSRKQNISCTASVGSNATDTCMKKIHRHFIAAQKFPTAATASAPLTMYSTIVTGNIIKIITKKGKCKQALRQRMASTPTATHVEETRKETAEKTNRHPCH